MRHYYNEGGEPRMDVLDLRISQERDIMASLMISDDFCCEIVPKIKGCLQDVFMSQYYQILADWICRYYEKIGRAPRSSLSKLYRVKCVGYDDDTNENLRSCLRELYDFGNKIEGDFDLEFELRTAIRHLNWCKLQKIKSALESYEYGDWSRDEKEVLDEVVNFIPETRNKLDEIDFTENEVVEEYLSGDLKRNVIFKARGRFGDVMGDVCEHDFIGFAAPMKRGKSWALIQAGRDAVWAGKRVLHISLEMSKGETFNRYWNCFFNENVNNDEDEDVEYSDLVKNDATGKYELERKQAKIRCVDRERVKRRLERIRGSGGGLRIRAYPTSSLTVRDLRADINHLIKSAGWIPDVVIVDYADLMASQFSRDEYRNRLNSIWQGLRGMAQEFPFAIITATQTGRRTIGAKKIGAEDTAEDIRKNAHVTAMIAIDQDEREEKAGLVGMHCLLVRNSAKPIQKAYFGQCLSLGKIAMGDGCWESELDSSVLSQLKKHDDS